MMDPSVEQTRMSPITFFTSYTALSNPSRHTKSLFRVQNQPIFQIAQTVAISVSHLQTLFNSNDPK